MLWERILCGRWRNKLSGLTPGQDRAHRVSRVNHTRYAVGSNPGVRRDKWPDSPLAGRKIPCFMRKPFAHGANGLRIKLTSVLCGRQRFGFLVLALGQTRPHRVTPVNNTRYAVTKMKSISASRSMEEARSLCKSIETYHAAVGEPGQYRKQTARLNAHRVTPIT